MDFGRTYLRTLPNLRLLRGEIAKVLVDHLVGLLSNDAEDDNNIDEDIGADFYVREEPKEDAILVIMKVVNGGKVGHGNEGEEDERRPRDVVTAALVLVVLCQQQLRLIQDRPCHP